MRLNNPQPGAGGLVVFAALLPSSAHIEPRKLRSQICSEILETCSGLRRRGVLSYVLVEVGGAPNHECPNRKVNSESNDYFHIIAPSMVCALRCIGLKDLEACQLGLALISLRQKLRPAEAC